MEVEHDVQHSMKVLRWCSYFGLENADMTEMMAFQTMQQILDFFDGDNVQRTIMNPFGWLVVLFC